MRLLVCGGRDFHNWNFVNQTLRDFHKEHGISVLIHGDADGADKLAGAWAWDRQINTIPFHTVSEAAVSRMFVECKPDHVIAFPGGVGTANVVLQAEEHGITVTEY